MAAPLLVILLLVLIIIFGPLLVIWALNTLFPLLAIPYTFWTWLAVQVIAWSIKSNVTIKK